MKKILVILSGFLISSVFAQNAIPPLQGPASGVKIPPPPLKVPQIQGTSPAPQPTPPITKPNPIRKIAAPAYKNCLLELKEASELKTDFSKKTLKISINNVKCIKGILISNPSLVDFEINPVKNEFILKISENKTKENRKSDVSLASNANKISISIEQTFFEEKLQNAPSLEKPAEKIKTESEIIVIEPNENKSETVNTEPPKETPSLPEEQKEKSPGTDVSVENKPQQTLSYSDIRRRNNWPR